MWSWKFKTAAAVACVTFAAGLLGYVYLEGRESGRQEVQARWNAEKTRQAEELTRLEQQARKREQDLQTAVDTLRQEKTDEANRLAAQYAAAVERLRDRPQRPAAASTPAPAPACPRVAAPVCTGQQLYREDAGFLVGEAARADRLRIDLAQCLGAYNSAREQLNAD